MNQQQLFKPEFGGTIAAQDEEEILTLARKIKRKRSQSINSVSYRGFRLVD